MINSCLWCVICVVCMFRYSEAGQYAHTAKIILSSENFIPSRFHMMMWVIIFSLQRPQRDVELKYWTYDVLQMTDLRSLQLPCSRSAMIVLVWYMWMNIHETGELVIYLRFNLPGSILEQGVDAKGYFCRIVDLELEKGKSLWLENGGYGDIPRTASAVRWSAVLLSIEPRNFTQVQYRHISRLEIFKVRV